MLVEVEVAAFPVPVILVPVILFYISTFHPKRIARLMKLFKIEVS